MLLQAAPAVFGSIPFLLQARTDPLVMSQLELRYSPIRSTLQSKDEVRVEKEGRYATRHVRQRQDVIRNVYAQDRTHELAAFETSGMAFRIIMFDRCL